MARPDTQPNDFVFPLFPDGRDLHPPLSLHQRDPNATTAMTKGALALRESHRDTSRDFQVHRDNVNNTTYYHTPVSPLDATTNGVTSASGLPGSAGRLAANAGGYPAGAMPSPRMFGAASGPHGHTIGTLSNSEGWSSSLSAPTHTRSSAGSISASSVAVQAQVQPNGVSASQHPLIPNHHHPSSPPRPPAPPFSPTSAQAHFNDRERASFRDAFYTTRHTSQQLPQQQQQQQLSISPPTPQAQSATSSSPTSANPPRTTLWWGELEPWMDEEYAKQVCNLMGWDPVNIKVPRPAPDPTSGRQVANNPGYCFLTFPSQSHAASVLAQINNNNSNANAMTMPNSSRPFNLNWASSVPNAQLSGSGFQTATVSIPGAQNPQYPKEYSIFVGDLAPEVSNSDLVAVFRNPVLGLRNDREPRFIRPFFTCKSAKIMLDPVTGVSRGYGFVRFTDEADQQRALIEMHGLYCLSRPMRISPATAKFKSPPGISSLEFASMQYPGMVPAPINNPGQVSISLPVPDTSQTKSVSTPLAAPPTNASTSGSSSSLGAASNPGSIGAPGSLSSSSTLANADENTGNPPSTSPTNVIGGAGSNPIGAALAQQAQDQMMAQRHAFTEESWKHHAQARAILSNLMGPNGEQLSSSDPYNTTVFVGGLSPLISEETLRTFFAPFGEIHYVKVPVGKHCGFVQFVRKPDAENAIEKMQGFPIGGSRIRLSWGRSQYKAAQAAAQAAQTAALQAQMVPPTQNGTPLTVEQAMQLLEKFGIAQFLGNSTLPVDAGMTNTNPDAANSQNGGDLGSLGSGVPNQHDGFHSNGHYGFSSFSPFSPDPNYLADGAKGVAISQPQPELYSYRPNGYSPWYTAQDDKTSSNGSGKVSPTSLGASRPNSSGQRFGSYLDIPDTSPPFQHNRATARLEVTAPIARPDLSKRAPQVRTSPERDTIHELGGAMANFDFGWKAPGGEVFTRPSQSSS